MGAAAAAVAAETALAAELTDPPETPFTSEVAAAAAPADAPAALFPDTAVGVAAALFPLLAESEVEPEGAAEEAPDFPSP